MLDENLPTYRFKTSTDNPLQTVLFFSHNGTEPSAEYVLKRPQPSSCANQYALGLVDASYTSVVYGEVLVNPGWSQPTLSAAEVRAHGASPPPPATPLTPDSFAVALYNPDQSIVVRHQQSGWSKTDSWEFEMPENSFKLPSGSQIDREGDSDRLAEITPKVVFRWRRDGRMSKDMTCYMSGRTIGGKKSKEPDITVALFRGRQEGVVTIYEPNMARVDVEDRKGLEVAFLLSAEVVRDLWLNPRPDTYNTAGARPPGNAAGKRKESFPSHGAPNNPPAAMSGALNSTASFSTPASHRPSSRADLQHQAAIDAETERLKALVAEEERQSRERERRDEEEQKRIKKMLEREDKERRRREAEVAKETERLRREYGVQGQGLDGPTPTLPPRHDDSSGAGPSHHGGWSGQPGPQRPSSVGPPPQSRPHFAAPPGPYQQQQQQQQQQQHQQQAQQPPPQQNGHHSKKKHGLTQFLQGPYGGPAGASVSGFFNNLADEEKRKRVQKKRSVHF